MEETSTVDTNASSPLPRGTSEEEIKIVRSAFDQAFQVAVTYNRPFFELASRMYKLWRGERPEVLQSTFSQMMINVAFGEVSDRVPKLKEGLMSDPLFDLQANTPEAEAMLNDALAWGRDLFTNANKLNIRGTIDWTLQSACIMGTGYRQPKISKNAEGKNIITSEHVDFFTILPMPDGGMVNSLDKCSSNAVSGFFQICWLSVEEIKGLADKEGGNAEEVEAFLSTEGSGDFGHDDQDYSNKWSVIGGIDYGSDSSLRGSVNGLPNQGDRSKRRCTFWHQRDRLIIVGEDHRILFNGDSSLPKGILPLAKYSLTPDLDAWHGIGVLEMIEDLVLAFLMNQNFRMDYLYRVFFPTKYIRQDIMGDRSEDEFVDGPYQIHPFPRDTNIKEALHVDRMPELNQQAFIEDSRMSALIQQISGMPNYARGMGGSGSLGNDTATGIVSLIKQAQGRLSSEVEQLETMGLTQEIRLVYILAEKFITEDQIVKNPQDPTGFGWSSLRADALADRYTILPKGAKQMATQEAEFQKLLAMYPMWNGDPDIDQIALKEKVVESSGLWRGSESPVLTQQTPEAPLPPEEEAMLGGITSAQDLEGRGKSVAGRNTKEADTGRDRQVGAY